MVEKKSTSAVKTTAKKASSQKAISMGNMLNAENVGFKAGDVYNALAAANKALTVAEIAKTAEISMDEVLLGIGWLLKEGKVKDEANKMTLA